MKLFEIRDRFGLDQLGAAERPDPAPGPREALVRVRAASINYRDLLVVEGKYNPRMQLPRVPLSDGAGEIVAVGAEVDGWKAGDRVVLPFMPGWTEGPLTRAKAGSALGGDVDGMLRGLATFEANALLPVPAHLDFIQAATLPCAAVTAWNGLFVAGALTPGQTVLLQGTGGVSIFGLQLAKAAGARVIILSSSDAKLERARALGADETINYKAEPDWEKKVLALTGGEGVDVTLEVGGAGTLARTLKATRYGGRVSLIGVLSGSAGEVPIGPILHKMLQVDGIYVGSRAMFAEMDRFLSQKRIEPVIDRVFDFDASPEAFRYFQQGAHFGKVAIGFKAAE
jgi:NADPH:quinone reductase-like Zn-dependent oxidoreductase